MRMPSVSLPWLLWFVFEWSAATMWLVSRGLRREAVTDLAVGCSFQDVQEDYVPVLAVFFPVVSPTDGVMLDLLPPVLCPTVRVFICLMLFCRMWTRMETIWVNAQSLMVLLAGAAFASCSILTYYPGYVLLRLCLCCRRWKCKHGRSGWASSRFMMCFMLAASINKISQVISNELLFFVLGHSCTLRPKIFNCSNQGTVEIVQSMSKDQIHDIVACVSSFYRLMAFQTIFFFTNIISYAKSNTCHSMSLSLFEMIICSFLLKWEKCSFKVLCFLTPGVPVFIISQICLFLHGCWCMILEEFQEK